MIASFTFQSGTCIPAHVTSGGNVHWIDVASPSEEELLELQQTHDIPLDFLTAVLDRNERPRLEQSDNATLVLLRVPQGKKQENDHLFTTRPIAIIITKQTVITVCDQNALVQKIMAAKKIKEVNARPHMLIAFNILKQISTTFIDDLHQMDQQTELTEHTLRKSMRNEELINLLHLEKSLIYFMTALRGNLVVTEQLGRDKMLEFKGQEKKLLSAAAIENKQAADMASIYSEVLGSLGDTFGSIVSNNLNKVMKFLTGMTIVLMIPTILGSYYGMNVPLPFSSSPLSFVFILLASGISSLLIWYCLWKRDWM